MTREEFGRIMGIIKSFWPREQFFATQESTSTFFNIMNRFEYRDISSALNTLVETSQYAPSMAEIVHAVEKAGQDRRDAERRQQNARQAFHDAVACTKCNDSGYIRLWHEDGTEAIKPCSCAAAREKFPWAFKDDEEWKAYVEERRRKGQMQSYDRPGRTPEWFAERCGAVVDMRPGGHVK